MLTVSLLLAGVAIAISGVAISIAVYHDVQDRDNCIRPKQNLSVQEEHAQRPTLRLWEQPVTHERQPTFAAPPRLIPAPGPDIVLGDRPAGPAVSPAETPSRRKAA